MQAQDCPPEVACPEFIITDGALFGDFFLGDQGLAGGQNRVVLQVPPNQALTITLRNVQNPADPQFNQLYVYADLNVNVNLRAGQIRQFRVTPQKTFIRGTLSHTCDVRSAKPEDDIRCAVIIDGAGRGEFPIGQAADFILDPGNHVVQIQLVGGSAGLWEPTLKEQNSSITAGRSTRLSTRFDKRAHLIINLNRAGFVGDIFVNDVLVAGQAPLADLYIPPNANQNIVVRNIQPPDAGFRWLESSASIQLGPNQERTVTVRLRQEPLVTQAQRTAINAMQSKLDGIRTNWQTIANIWRGLSNGQTQTCYGNRSRQLAPVSAASINQNVRSQYPEYQAALDVLNTAINNINIAIENWNTECSISRQYVDQALLNGGLRGVNDAEAQMNDLQGRLNALLNPPQ